MENSLAVRIVRPAGLAMAAVASSATPANAPPNPKDLAPGGNRSMGNPEKSLSGEHAVGFVFGSHVPDWPKALSEKATNKNVESSFIEVCMTLLRNYY